MPDEYSPFENTEEEQAERNLWMNCFFCVFQSEVERTNYVSDNEFVKLAAAKADEALKMYRLRFEKGE